MILLDEAGAGSPHASLIAAPQDVAPLVQHAFVQRHPVVASPGRWRVVPEAHANILAIVAHGSPEVRFIIIGPRSQFADVDLTGRRATIGVRLELGALPVLTGLPASDFADRVVPVSSLSVARSDRLSGIGDDPAESAIIEALFDFVAVPARGGSARYTASALRGVTRGTELGVRFGVARRTIYARLMAEVGLAPRRFHRVERLERALNARSVGVTWARAASVAGYADQAHLTREAHRLLGESPRQWSARGLVAQSFKTAE